jgi:predicted nucleotidyltransferase component of viral defense system
MVQVLLAIYSHPDLRTVLGFKGGTAAMLFYDLSRFSVDLDFDLIDTTKKELVLREIEEILKPMGTVRDATEKRFTLFFLLDYGKDERNLKVEISTRPTPSNFESRSFLGQSMLVTSKPDMMACKLAALSTRKNFAIRDVFDMWFFLSEHWEMNEDLVKVKCDLTWRVAIKESIKRIEKLNQNEILQGLGELLTPKQKDWAKDKLVKESIFLLKLYMELRKNS